MRSFGAYAFNKSHSVCYGLISYWCAWLKAHYPLEFAVACLKNSANESQTVKMLRELVNEGFEYVPFDPVNSEINWSVQKGVLVGGLTGIKGVGPKMADDIAKRRRNNEELTIGQSNKLNNPSIYYSDVFECNTRYGGYYKKPELFGINSGLPVSYIKDITVPGDYIFLGKLVEKNLKELDVEENKFYLNLILEDDTDKIMATVNRWNYSQLGNSVGNVDEYYLVRGYVRSGYRKVYVDIIKNI